MATIKAHKSLNFFNLPDDDGFKGAYSGANLGVIKSPTQKIAFTGNFTYGNVNANEVYGTLQGLEHFLQDNLFYSMTNINADVGTFFTLFSSGKTIASIQFLLKGNDKFYGSAFNDVVFGAAGNDKAWGGNGNDKILGQKGNDIAFGGAGNDILKGGGGADKASGGDGADKLFGDAGNDVLNGGNGKDQMTGGPGSDKFVFAAKGAANADRVLDFKRSDDDVQLQDSAFWAIHGQADGHLKPSEFRLGTSAKDANDYILYQQSTGKLWYDRDGNGPSNKILIAEFNDGTPLFAIDVFVI